MLIPLVLSFLLPVRSRDSKEWTNDDDHWNVNGTARNALQKIPITFDTITKINAFVDKSAHGKNNGGIEQKHNYESDMVTPLDDYQPHKTEDISRILEATSENSKAKIASTNFSTSTARVIVPDKNVISSERNNEDNRWNNDAVLQKDSQKIPITFNVQDTGFIEKNKNRNRLDNINRVKHRKNLPYKHGPYIKDSRKLSEQYNRFLSARSNTSIVKNVINLNKTRDIEHKYKHAWDKLEPLHHDKSHESPENIPILDSEEWMDKNLIKPTEPVNVPTTKVIKSTETLLNVADTNNTQFSDNLNVPEIEKKKLPDNKVTAIKTPQPPDKLNLPDMRITIVPDKLNISGIKDTKPPDELNVSGIEDTKPSDKMIINDIESPKPSDKLTVPDIRGVTDITNTTNLEKINVPSIKNPKPLDKLKVPDKKSLHPPDKSTFRVADINTQTSADVLNVSHKKNTTSEHSNFIAKSRNGVQNRNKVDINKVNDEQKNIDTVAHKHSDPNFGKLAEQHNRLPNISKETSKKTASDNNVEKTDSKHPVISIMKHPKALPKKEVRIKSRKSGILNVEVPAGKTTLLNDQGQKQVSVTVPSFRSTVISTGQHSFTFHMSHTVYDGVERWAMVVVKLQQTSFGRPIFLKGKPKEYKSMFKKYEDSPDYDDPYIAAQFEREGVPYMFTVGDGKEYMGCLNGELASGQYYALFMVGIVYGFRGTEVYVESGWVVDAHAPDVPTYFHTKEATSVFWPVFGCLAIATFAFAFFIWFYWKNGKLSVFFKKMKSKTGRYSRFNTGYKFDKLSHTDVVDTSYCRDPTPTKHLDVVDSYFQFGNNTATGIQEYKLSTPSEHDVIDPSTKFENKITTLPAMRKTVRKKQNKPKNTRHIVNDDEWKSESSHVEHQLSHGSNLQRHFRSEQELEETVMSMTPSTDGVKW